MWTYDGDPAGDRKDEIRFLVGDTDPATPLVQDEEIGYLLTQFPQPDPLKPAYLAAAHVCDAIAAKFARKVQQGLGPLSASNQQQYEHYVAEAQKYRVLYATNGKGIVSGTMGGVVAAAPRLSGGGPTVLGGNTYSSPAGSA